MHVTIQKWGNSLAFRIPQSMAKQVHVRKGSVVDMTLRENKIILVAVTDRKYHLAGLLKKVTARNCHPECSWGTPVAREVW